MEEKTPRRRIATGWTRGGPYGAAVGSYMLLMGLLLYAAQALGALSSLRGHTLGPFLALGLIVAVLWAFGWGAGEWLAGRLSSQRGAASRGGSIRGSILRAVIPGVFSGVVYLLITVPLRAAVPLQLLLYCALPAALATVFEALPPGETLSWQDLLVLAGLALPIEYSWLRMPPGPDLGGLPKLLWADVALYVYVVQRRLPGIGFDLRLRLRDLTTGLRAWGLFVPIGLGLGLALGFLRVHAHWPAPGPFIGLVVVTFVFVAVPEELFFRGLLQNLLQTRLPRWQALGVASALFGLAHYIHGPVFNWRYVILAALAGGFYGCAWQRDRRTGAAAVAHTLVDVVWVTWWLNRAAL